MSSQGGTPAPLEKGKTRLDLLAKDVDDVLGNQFNPANISGTVAGEVPARTGVGVIAAVPHKFQCRLA